MASKFGSYTSHADTIHCPRCGKTGSIVWEDVCRPEGNAKELIRIEGDFYERLANKPPFPIELVCNGCGVARQSPLQA